ncbi:MAG TPA: HU family DNA-binding protein [Terriglobales bacterium]|jgi:DNA-binding protein HU-beta|nr:HU family DNA-binding protein [Terriglobales bacterium]
MIKSDIVHAVVARTGTSKAQAELAVEAVFERMKRALASDDRIELRGFGVFNVRPRKTGVGRNPRTGAEVTIAPGKSIKFRPGKDMSAID